ncbi:hypothetical protein D9756_003384 [Leucocoprinus leucothites]|uniref:F-box domain-containing protein n=1 Tax=Leucocoprinus leucothites TaxID=201217 RepID=A0A8H5LJ81_9AGAR|nr:hypothetical protein D9756_003384 [Leucoagaricus leucothites]
MPSATPPLSEPPESELVSVKQDIGRLKGTIDGHSAKTADLPKAGLEEDSTERALQLRRSNESQSNTKILPVEILSTIFQFTCVPPSSSLNVDLGGAGSRETYSLLASALALSAVSHHWRRVAVSTPKLWQTLKLQVENEKPHQAQICTDLLRLCIDRSCSVMDLLLDFRLVADVGTTLRTLPHPEVPEVLLDQLEWLVFVDLPHVFRELSLLSLDKVRWSQLAFLLAPLSQLKMLRVDRSRMYYMQAKTDISKFRDVLGPRLTMLDLSYSHYDLSVELLLHCPNLIQCRSAFSTHPRNDTIWVNSNDDNHVLPRLEWLHWSAIRNPNGLRFATTSVPALRYLKWDHRTPPPDDDSLVPDIDTAFIRFLSTATKLEEFDIAIANRYVASPARILALLPRIIAATPSGVQKLTLHVTRGQLATIPSPFITPLMGRPSVHSALTIPLPALKALSLILDPGPVERPSVRREDWIATNLVAFLRQRRQLGLVHEFNLSFNFTSRWDDKVYEGFRELVREGLRLQVDIDGRPVSWLHL